MRIQQIDGYESLIKGLADVEDYTKVLCIAHKGTSDDPNPHYHLVIETIVKEKAFWKRMMAKFTKGKGNKHASHKLWDGKLEACSYMFHEDDDNANVIVSKGFSVDDISSIKLLNKEVKQRIEDAKSGSHTEKQLAKHKKTIWDVIEEVRTLMPKSVLQLQFEERVVFEGRMTMSGEREYPEETAYSILIDILEKYKVRANEHELKRWLDTILRIDPCFNHVKKNILSRYRQDGR